MIGSLIKAFAYTKAPKTTYAALHPKNAARLKKLEWDMKHAYAPRLTALGVAAVALPLGIVLGRLTAGRRSEPQRGPRVNPNARRTGWPDEVGARPDAREWDDDMPHGYETDAPRAHMQAKARARSTTGTTTRSTTTGTAPSTAPHPRDGGAGSTPGV